MRLLTNNPEKHAGLHGWGLDIVERIPILTGAHDDNRQYLATKRDRMGHLLPGDDEIGAR
jgi:3,4-dihydroxy 2-butanone 4-phosphate synthase/GTP cyclohydrolase II